jgi:hypothetical protein
MQESVPTLRQADLRKGLLLEYFTVVGMSLRPSSALWRAPWLGR